ncbi:MAG: hypothetical protein K940chlam2_01221 [Chlamydiae bacterium]|nr:hypothetical protein [Chlamydiota bacterium]
MKKIALCLTLIGASFSQPFSDEATIHSSSDPSV